MKVLPTATLPTRNPPAMEAEVTPAARSPSSPTATAPSPYATRQPARPTVAAALVTRPTRTGRAVARPAVLDPERLVLPSFSAPPTNRTASAAPPALPAGRVTPMSVVRPVRLNRMALASAPPVKKCRAPIPHNASAHALRDGRITTPSVAQLARPRLRPASVPVPAPNRS